MQAESFHRRSCDRKFREHLWSCWGDIPERVYHLVFARCRTPWPLPPCPYYGPRGEGTEGHHKMGCGAADPQEGIAPKVDIAKSQAVLQRVPLTGVHKF